MDVQFIFKSLVKQETWQLKLHSKISKFAAAVKYFSSEFYALVIRVFLILSFMQVEN